MKSAVLDQALHNNFSEEELASNFSIRGYKLTPKGEQILEQYQRHCRPPSKEKSLGNQFSDRFSVKSHCH